MNDRTYRLRSEGLIHLRGVRIAEFLQGQLTCDTRRLSPELSVPGALCSVKGRVISDLRVIQVDEEHCLLRLRRSVATHCAAVLARYAQFSRIRVEAEENPLITGLLAGTGTAADPALPDQLNAVVRDDGCISIRVGKRRIERIFPDGSAHGRTDNPAEAEYRALTLGSGHYCIEAEDLEQFTPQQLNYDRSDRISFDKGCYTGQEVVARLHYKGRSKRRLRVFRMQAAQSGTTRSEALFTGDRREVGALLRAEAVAPAEALIAALVNDEEPVAPLFLDDGRRLDPLPAGDGSDAGQADQADQAN